MLKKYFGFVFIGTLFFVEFGIVIPYLMSATDDILVLCGTFVIIAMFPIYWWLVKLLLKEEKKDG